MYLDKCKQDILHMLFRILNFLQRLLQLILKSVFNFLKMKLARELVGPLGGNFKSSAVSKNIGQIHRIIES